MEQGLRLL